jgi:hypothetical protein
VAKPAFPHMFPNDVPLFSAFVLSPEAEKFDRWDFDVKVGVPVDPGPAYNPQLRQMAIAISLLRIDAVGFQATQPTIFEVKPDARLSALGQVIAYCYYYQKQFGVACRRGIITDSMTPQVAEIYTAYDIAIHLVRPATSIEILLAQRKVNGLPGR